MRVIWKLAMAIVAVASATGVAHALVKVDVDLASQTMRVTSSSGANEVWPISSGRLGHAKRGFPACPSLSDGPFVQIRRRPDAAFDLLLRAVRHPRHDRRRHAGSAGFARLHPPRAGARRPALCDGRTGGGEDHDRRRAERQNSGCATSFGRRPRQRPASSRAQPAGVGEESNRPSPKPRFSREQLAFAVLAGQNRG